MSKVKCRRKVKVRSTNDLSSLPVRCCFDIRHSSLSIGPAVRRLRLLALAAAIVPAMAAGSATATDYSPPAILQWFETSWNTMQNRSPDVFMAGYGAVQVPPPYRADSGNQSVGYDVYDRFDLGLPGDPTLYGTQAGLQAAIGSLHQSGVNVYADMVWNQDGFSDWSTSGFQAAGGYPGFVLSTSSAAYGDFHDPSAVRRPGYAAGRTNRYRPVDEPPVHP